MTRTNSVFRTVAIFAVLLTLQTFGQATVTWDGSIDATWTEPDSDSFDAVYSSGDNAVFDDTGSAVAVTIDGTGVTPGSTSITSDTKNYTFSGGSILGGALTKSGTGTATLSNGANSFSGITISGGTLRYNDPNQLGTGSITFTDDSSLTYVGSVPATISGGAIDGGAFPIISRIVLGGAILARDVTGNTFTRIANGAVSGAVSGNFQVQSDTVALTGTNNAINTAYLGWNGQVGVLEITDPRNLSGGGSATVSFNNYGGTLRIAGEPSSPFVDSIQISGAGGTAPIIEVQDPDATVDWTGTFQFNADGSAVVKTGPGTLNLSNITSTVSTRTLAIAVNDGTLNINDADSGLGAYGSITVGNGGTLGGTGTLDLASGSSLTANAGGTVTPGASVGTLTVDLAADTTSVTLDSGATLEYELGAPGTGDLLQINNFTAGDLTFNDNVINFIDTGGLGFGSYTLMAFYSDDGTTPIDHGLTSGMVIGTGLTLGGNIDYTSTLGEIRLQVVPEPSSLVLLGLSGLLLTRVRRRTA